MSAWMTSMMERTAGVRQAAGEYAAATATAAREYATSTTEALKTTDVRTLASNAAENAGKQAADLRQAAHERTANLTASVREAAVHADQRAKTLEGRMRMEAATASEYAHQMKYKGNRIVKKVKGQEGPPTAEEFIEILNAESKSIKYGSCKGQRIAHLRKWAKLLDSDTTYEEDLAESEPEPEPEPEPEAEGEASPTPALEPEPELEPEPLEAEPEASSEPKTLRERLAEAQELALKKAAALDKQYDISGKAAIARERAIAAAADARVRAQAAAADAAVRVDNYRKGVVVEPLPADLKAIRVVTVKECFLRSDVLANLVSSFMAEAATPGSESVRMMSTMLKHLTHGSEQWKAEMAETIAAQLPPTLRGRDVKAKMQQQLCSVLTVASVDSEIEKLRVNLSSNQNAATQLRTELSDIDAAPVEGADDTIAKKLELSGHLLKINEEERDFTAQLQSLLEGKAKVALNDSQSECDKVIASTKELYSDQSEKLVGEKQSIGEQQESVSTEKELAEMQYQESEAAIQAELDTLRVRETALQAELTEVQGAISGLEKQREDAAAARDGVAAKAQSQVGKIAMTDQQLETQQEGVKLELAGVEAVEKVLDDTFFEIGRDVSELAAAIATSSADLDTARLEMLSRHVALVGAALIDFQNKIGFCATELSERIDKRESMIKMGMENVADSLIPGFDQLEEKFVELVQAMKTVVTDFAVVQETADAVVLEEQASEVNSELASQIQERMAELLVTKTSLEAAAAALEGKIEMEEVKWRGEASPTATPAESAATVDDIVGDLAEKST